jgi:hypothetical protein
MKMDNNIALKIYTSLGNNPNATKLLTDLTKSLVELFNYFEPAFFNGMFYVCNELDDEFILPQESSQLITLNKERLLNQNNNFAIQLIDNNLYFWEEFDENTILNHSTSLIYKFENNKEYFIANKKVIEITEQNFGSKFSNEFWELNNFLERYALQKIRQSSCPIFNESWFDQKRIFFKGGGKDIPESYMQNSLKNFIDDIRIFKGEIGQYENDREHTLGSERPIDLFIKWEKSNRIALIEIKWLGKSKNDEGRITSTHTNSRANEGYRQLKEYYELAKRDYPTKIIKCYLVVIDARRWQTNEATTSISYSDGMHYTDKELDIDSDKQYWETYPDIEKPIRMFVEPICEM